MDYTKHDMGNYDLYLIKTKKFKTISVSINFRRENDREDEVYRSILKRILGLSTEKHHDVDELCRARMSIYDPKIRIGAAVSGQDRWLYLESMFANEKYTEKGMNAQSLEFIFDILWHPYIVDGGFFKEDFEICKHEYIEDVKSLKDNADKYSRNRAWEEMGVYPFKECNNKECIEIAQKMTEKDLYHYYQRIFNEDALDIFIAGDFDDEEMKTIVNNLVTGNFVKSYKNRLITQTSYRKEIKEVIEPSKNEQSKLVMGLKYTDLTDFERKYASLAYNSILGGSWNSKLNQVVREEHSLCYYVNSIRQITFGVSFIRAGIDAANYSKTVDLIKKQMTAMINGEFEERDLNQVKTIYNNALIDIEDNQFSILDKY